MEIMEVISLLCLAAVLIVGVCLKRHTRRALSDIDGLGGVSKNDDDVVGRF